MLKEDKLKLIISIILFLIVLPISYSAINLGVSSASGNYLTLFELNNILNNYYNKSEVLGLIPNFSNISSGMNVSGEFRYNTDFVGGYTFPSRTLEVIQDEIGLNILPVGVLYGEANSMISKSTTGTNLSDVVTQFVGTTSTTGYNQEWINTRNLRKFDVRFWESSATVNLRQSTIGCWRASSNAVMTSIYEGAFFQIGEGDNYTINLCNSATGCTSIETNVTYIENKFVYLTITTDAPNILDGKATIYHFWINGTYVGSLDDDLPDYTAMCGVWTENRDTTLNRMAIDNFYAEFTRKN